MSERTSSALVSSTASFTNEWSALLECASPSHDRQRLASLLRSADWARFLVLAEEHGVVGLVAARLRDLQWESVPPEIKQTLIDRRRAQIFFSLRMTAELFRILDRFASVGIGALVVKGPTLAMRAYGDPAMRSYGDLDLLVRQRDIRCATELMSAAGYQPAVSLSAIDAAKIPGQYLFSHSHSNLLVELHNDLTLRYFPRPLPLEDFFARQIRVPLDGREAPALAIEDELVLICIHGAKHFWERLMWIADVAALVTRQSAIDWKRVADSATAVGAERMLHTGLRLASDLLKTQLPGEVLATVQADGVAARLAEQTCKWLPAAGNAPPGLFERAAFRMRMRGSMLSAPAYLFRLSFSPTEEDWHESGDGLPRKVLDMLRRPLRLARKYSRGGKS
jgi:Uncharacterised nucleotidyltransferase